MAGDGSADQRAGDVVEKAGNDEHERKQDKAARPIVRQNIRGEIRETALFQVARQDLKAGQQESESFKLSRQTRKDHANA
jgi:hypothetical protein